MGMFDKYKKDQGMFGAYKTPGTSTDVRTLEGLISYAASQGIKVKEDKPSLFTRALDVIQRPLYASAGAAKAIVTNIKAGETGGETENVLQEAWDGLTGKEKETYSDVLQVAGVENKWIRGGVGFALDVALDPTTYFGGAILKGTGKVLKAGTSVGLKAGKKIAPEVIGHLELAGASLKDAFGTAFKYGYGTTKGLSDDVAKYFNKLGVAKETIIAKNFTALDKFGDDVLSQATDIMIKNKKIELGMREGATGLKFVKGEGEVANAVTEMKKIGASIGKMTGLPEEKIYENYFPSILNMRQRNYAEISKKIQVGKEGYLKKFADKLKNDEIINKPIEAYTRREFEVTRDLMTRETLNDMVTTYGLKDASGNVLKSVKEFSKLDDATKALYKPIYEKGYRPLGIYTTETATGATVKAIGKARNPLGYLKANDFKFIDTYFFPEMKTIDLLAKASGYDKFTNLFKTAVTAWFPAFHGRNILSGMVQNYSVLGAQAFNPENIKNSLKILKGSEKTILTMGKWTGTAKEMKTILNENFRSASRYISDIGDYIDDLGAKGFQIKSTIQKLNPRQLGTLIEMNQKATAVSTALRSGKTLQEAIKLAEKAGFDYTKITKFESKIMKRLVPFYTFARKNAELQVETLIKHPERILNQTKFVNGWSEIFGGKPTEEDLKGLPPWALAGLGFKIKDGRYLTTFGLPLEEFTNRLNFSSLKPHVTSLNPLIKFPIEAKMGWDFYREKKIIDVNTIAPVTGQLILDKAPDWLKDIMRVQKVESEYGTKYYANPEALHVLRNIPTSRLQNTLENVFNKDKNSVDKWMAFFTGGKIYDIDIELQNYFRERDLRRDIEDQLLNIGAGKMYETFYVPKK